MTGLKRKATVLEVIRFSFATDRVLFVGIMFASVFQGATPVVMATAMKYIFDIFASPKPNLLAAQTSQQTNLIGWFVVYIVASVASSIILRINAYLNANFALKLAMKTQLEIIDYVGQIDQLQQLEHAGFGNTLALAVRGVQSAPAQLISVFTGFVASCTLLFGFSGALISAGPVLLSMVIVSLFPHFIIQNIISGQRYGIAQQSTLGERFSYYYAQILCNPEYIKEIKTFNAFQYFRSLYVNRIKSLQILQRNQVSRELLVHTGVLLLSSAITATALYFIVQKTFAREISVGSFSIFISASLGIQQGVVSLLSSLGNFRESLMFFENFTAIKTSKAPTAPLRSGRVPELTDSIEFCNVSFRYAENRPWILRHVNMKIPARTRVGLVGINGAGKSTLVKLLLRFYDPVEGQILWDGVDIREFDFAELRSNVSAIFQEFRHYDATAAVNIGIGDVANIDNVKSITTAAQLSGVHADLVLLPLGYNTLLTRFLGTPDDSADLSGGQWQKIAIARLFMKNASLYIFDEPTSSLDPKAEYELLSNIMSILSQKTSLVISHRLGNLRNADKIAVLKDGGLIEFGSHQDLMILNGFYADLFRTQAKEYAEI